MCQSACTQIAFVLTKREKKKRSISLFAFNVGANPARLPEESSERTSIFNTQERVRCGASAGALILSEMFCSQHNGQYEHTDKLKQQSCISLESRKIMTCQKKSAWLTVVRNENGASGVLYGKM